MARGAWRRCIRAVVLGALALAIIAPGARAAIGDCAGTGETFAGGDGTSASPYLVATAEQLAAINSSFYRHCAFRQTADIALSGEWTPIGDGAAMFTGEYDGDGHRISGLRITRGTSYLGLFGYTGVWAVIENLRLSGTVDVPGAVGVGALIGLADRPTTITNVHSSVDVSAGGMVGGLVGWLAESVIRRSSATGSVTAANGSVGGLVGFARSVFGGLSSEITDSYATGSVTGGTGYAGVGGLVGHVQVDASSYTLAITRSYAAGPVTGGTGSRTECEPGEDPGDPPMCSTYSGTTGGLVAPSEYPPETAGMAVESGFWDTQTTGRAATADDKGTGATTAQMQSRATFAAAGWDISDGWSPTAVWGICEGSTYPFLNAEYVASPCHAASSPTARPDARIAVSTPIDDVARVTVRWSAAEDTAPTTLTTTLPRGVMLLRERRLGRAHVGCASARGRVVSIAVPALHAGDRGSCSFTVVTTRPTLSLALAGGSRRIVSATVRATASSSAWVEAAVAILRRGMPRATLNDVLDAVGEGRMTRASAAAIVRHDVLGVRVAQRAAIARLDRAPARLARAEHLLRRAVALSARADRAYVAWLDGQSEMLERAIGLSLRATAAKARLMTALRGGGTDAPAASLLWP